jgi:PPM family protein phosphatase
MSIGIRYAARSDVGMLREGNEDSAYAGAHLLAVADGMGGHVGGEIASAAAIGELRKLDTDLPAPELLAALEHTVKAANEKLHRIVESDPALQGMGTTLTAMLWSGNQVALVHIGDSRAYLLRDGSLFQITHDHTLVQSLVDEGRISPDEAASHPQRSLLLRALDGRGEVDPDLSLREAKVGDRYLLCSDGLSGVVTAETIFQVLSEYADPEQAVRQLIDLANRGGGPDNITCVVADVVDLGQSHPAAGGAPMAVGAAANAQRMEMDGSGGGGGGNERSSDTPAGRAAQLRDTMPQQPVVVDEMPPPAPAPLRDQHPHQPQPQPLRDPQAGGPAPLPRRGGGRRRWAWLVIALVVFLAVVGTLTYVGLQTMRSERFYATNVNGKVVVFQGEPESVLGFDLFSRAKSQPNPEINVRDLPQHLQAPLNRKPYLTLKGSDGWRNLQSQVCRYTLVVRGDRVAIEQGVDQDGCQPGKPTESQLRLAELPAGDRKQVEDKKLTFPNLPTAQNKLRDLETRRDACKQDPNAFEDCPSGRSEGGRGS